MDGNIKEPSLCVCIACANPVRLFVFVSGQQRALRLCEDACIQRPGEGIPCVTSGEARMEVEHERDLTALSNCVDALGSRKPVKDMFTIFFTHLYIAWRYAHH